MKTIRETFKVASVGGRASFHTVTEQVQEIVTRNGIQSGICMIYSQHTTCAVITQECSFDEAYSGLEFLQQDLVDVFEKIIPTARKEGEYMHPGPKLTEFAAVHGEDKPGTLNTAAHLISSIIGRTVSVPIFEGKLTLGEFGHIQFIDFDHTRARNRTVAVQIIGE